MTDLIKSKPTEHARHIVGKVILPDTYGQNDLLALSGSVNLKRSNTSYYQKQGKSSFLILRVKSNFFLTKRPLKDGVH